MNLPTGNLRLIGWPMNVKNSVYGFQFDPRWDFCLVGESGCYLCTMQIYMGNAKKGGLPRTSTCGVRLKPECWKCSQEPSSRYLQKPGQVSRSRIELSRYQSMLENGLGSILPLGSRLNWCLGPLGPRVSFWLGNLVHEELVRILHHNSRMVPIHAVLRSVIFAIWLRKSVESCWDLNFTTNELFWVEIIGGMTQFCVRKTTDRHF